MQKKKKIRVLSFFGALDEYVLDEKKGSAHLSYVMATVLMMQAVGRGGGGGRGGPAGAPTPAPAP